MSYVFVDFLLFNCEAMTYQRYMNVSEQPIIKLDLYISTILFSSIFYQQMIQGGI